MRVYTPPQHTAKPHGCDHLTTFASVELWVDDMPDAIEIGGELFVRVESVCSRTDAECHARMSQNDDWGTLETHGQGVLRRCPVRIAGC